jgi:hypothetical protein
MIAVDQATTLATPPPALDPAARARARSYCRWIHDFGSGLILGGATVVLTLTLAGVSIRRDAFVILITIFIFLAVGQNAFRWALYHSLDPTKTFWSVYPRWLVLGVVLLIAGLVTGATSTFPARPDSFGWWSAIAFALLAVATGIVTRKRADDIAAALQ